MASYPRPARAARQELRELDGAALHRLFVAFHNMQQTDDWAKLAGMHGGGLPDSEDVKIARNRVYCHHRSETFPPWHRAYLAEFEYVLQNHDPWYPGDHMTANRIMLPFWDWSGTRFAEGYPEFVTWPSVRLYLDGEWKTVTNPLASGPHFQRRRTRRRRTTPDSIARELQFRAVRSEATDAINTDDHFSMSARNFSATSLEEPHDDVHVAVGGDMSGVDTAAFDPIFWLHHCNVERIYYAWQTHYPNEKPTNPQEEMGPFAPKAQFGKLMGWQNDTGKYTTVEEWFDLANLDYTFSYLLPSPTPRSSQMRVPRKYVVLRDVETPPESVSFYVYIQRKSDVKSAEGAEKAKVDFPQISSVIASPQIDEPDCVGVISVFSLDTYHADIECKKCEERDPFSYSLDVTSALQELGVKNSDEVIVTIQAKNSEDEDMQNMVIPEPVILHENDFFSLSDIDSDNLDKARKQDVASLKRVLAFYGYLKADVPLSQAIKDFQQKWGLKVDGVVGPNTKSLLHRPRSADPDDLANPILEIINKLKTGQRKFRYAIGRVVCYLVLLRLFIIVIMLCYQFVQCVDLMIV